MAAIHNTAGYNSKSPAGDTIDADDEELVRLNINNQLASAPLPAPPKNAVFIPINARGIAPDAVDAIDSSTFPSDMNHNSMYQSYSSATKATVQSRKRPSESLEEVPQHVHDEYEILKAIQVLKTKLKSTLVPSPAMKDLAHDILRTSRFTCSCTAKIAAKVSTASSFEGNVVSTNTMIMHKILFTVLAKPCL